MRLHKYQKSGDRPKRPWWRKKKTIALVIFCLLIVGVVKILSQPVNGHNVPIDVQLKKAAKSSTQSVSPASQTSNSYYQLNLPPGYNQQTAATNVPGLLISQLVTKPGSLGSLIINIAVKTVPEGGWQNDSSYRLREQKPSEYTTTTQTKDGDQLTISRDNQTVSLVIFWPHGGYLATIGISSSIDNPSTDEITQENSTLNTILGAWQWL